MDPHYFATLGTRALRGRPLTAGDTLGAPPVAVVNESFVRTFFPDADPLGQRVTVQDHPADIVGVFPDFKPARPDEPVPPQIYWPIQQYPRFGAYLVLRAKPESPVREEAIRDAIRDAGPAIQIAALNTLDSLFDRTLVSPRFNMAILGLFAILAVALAAVGVHGVIAFSVTSRTREIGLRVALGATPSRVTRQFVVDTSRLAVAGVAAGLALAVLLGPLFGHLLVGLPAIRPIWLAGLALAFVGIALLAGYIPARRASRIDPVKALAAE
jgi:putative ABC transport system permease protein